MDPVLAAGGVCDECDRFCTAHRFLGGFYCTRTASRVATGNHYWVLLGISAAVGPTASGWLADRIGFSRSLRASLFAKAIGVGLPLISTSPVALALSSIGVGSMGYRGGVAGGGARGGIGAIGPAKTRVGMDDGGVCDWPCGYGVCAVVDFCRYRVLSDFVFDRIGHAADRVRI